MGGMMPGMDPAMMGGMMPGMDPAMMGGMMPGMDPAGGMMDPAMGGNAIWSTHGRNRWCRGYAWV